jgi:hypothetical protein
MAIITTDVIPKLHATARTGQMAGIDLIGWTRPNIQVAHYMLHLGVHFFDVRSAIVGNAGTFFHLIKTPAYGTNNTEVHLQWNVSYTVSTDVELYEGITGADPTGTPLNSRRASTTVAEARCGSATTGYTGGTLLEKHLLGSATVTPKATESGQGREDELDLKPDTLYALKVTSNAADNRVTSTFLFYEPGQNILGVD